MINTANLSIQEQIELVKLLTAKLKQDAQNKIRQMYPDTGPYRRDLYPKHMEFFAAGKSYRERCFMAANRIGKSLGAGGYETALHLTGEYPHWWAGHRFPHEIDAWAAGKTNETTRDIVQAKLFGRVSFSGGEKCFSGDGLIPKDAIGKITWKSGVQDLADVVEVRHVSGFWSRLGLKSYQQGRGAFEGTEKHWVWLDEECPVDIYGEVLMRTATVDGRVVLTYTPLEGMTELVLSFLPPEMVRKFGDVAKESVYA